MQTTNDLAELFIRTRRSTGEFTGHDTPTAKTSSSSQNDYKKTSDFRAIFISDIHLGTKDCKAAQLNSFLKHHSCEQLYLVGDIFDGWRMKSGIYWHKSFNRVIHRVLKLAKKGIPVFYITGNHDEFLRKYANSRFDNIYLCNRKTHVTRTGKKILVIHGDQYESVTHCTKLLKYIGDRGYDWLMSINRGCNFLRARYGYGYWSFAAFLRQHLKRARQYIEDYERAVAHGAKRSGFDGVICGHIHEAADKQIEDIRYLNTGDWVESCTAVVEDFNGEFHLIRWSGEPTSHNVEKGKSSQSLRNKTLVASA